MRSRGGLGRAKYVLDVPDEKKDHATRQRKQRERPDTSFESPNARDYARDERQAGRNSDADGHLSSSGAVARRVWHRSAGPDAKDRRDDETDKCEQDPSCDPMRAVNAHSAASIGTCTRDLNGLVDRDLRGR
jgi:hypothetical protein